MLPQSLPWTRDLCQSSCTGTVIWVKIISMVLCASMHIFCIACMCRQIESKVVSRLTVQALMIVSHCQFTAIPCVCRQIESMAASAAAQQAAHAEAELQLIERLKTVEAALSEERESEQSLRVRPSQEPPPMSQECQQSLLPASCKHWRTVCLLSNSMTYGHLPSNLMRSCCCESNAGQALTARAVLADTGGILPCSDLLASNTCCKVMSQTFVVQGKLSQTERALAAARAGLEGAAAQTAELTEELGAERKRAGTLTNDVKRAGMSRQCRSILCKVLGSITNAWTSVKALMILSCYSTKSSLL